MIILMNDNIYIYIYSHYCSEVVFCLSEYFYSAFIMKIKQFNFLENKGGFNNTMKTLKTYVQLFLKNKVLIVLVVSSSLYVRSTEQYKYISAQCLQVKPTFILMGCHEYLYIFVCIWYDEDSFTQIKWSNADEVTLRAVMEMLFMYLQVHLKKCEYHEKGQYFCHSFQKVKPIYYIDSLHIVKYFKPLFLGILMIMLTDNENPKFSVSEKFYIT